MIKIKKKIKVLIIDDSALVRNILTQGLSKDPGIEVVGSAPDVFVGRDKIVRLKPDVLTLDIEMPEMDGIEFLRRLMPQYPIPVVVVSSLTRKGQQTTFDALEAGAVDFVSKPGINLVKGLGSVLMELATKIKIASTVDLSHWKNKRKVYANKTISSNALDESTDKIIAIGSSTGGTEALKRVVTKFPVNMPGVIIVQHMPAGFTKLYADKLNQLCRMEVKEAQNGDRVLQGRILVAPGDYHLRVKRFGGIYKVLCSKDTDNSLHCPSVDVMMDSVAKEVGKNAIGIMLTGMGKDGASGMLNMKKAGAYNIAQDERTSVVYGMPKVAFEYGGVDVVKPLEDIAKEVVRNL